MKGGIALDDKTIITRCQQGQPLLELLIRRYQTPLYRFCMHLTGDSQEAADLFQDSWVRVMKNIKLCDPDKKFSTWLYAITANLYKDRFRKQARWRNRIRVFASAEQFEVKVSAQASPAPTPEQASIDQETAQILLLCLNKLNDDYRLPLLLFYFREQSHADIAAILGIPIGTVKSRLHGGRRKLKELLEVDGYE